MILEQSPQNDKKSQDYPEPTTLTFSHDYPNDTTLQYSRSGRDSMLRLSFTSEDFDMGTEDLIYHGVAGETLRELAGDLKAEIKAYLDFQDRSSFDNQQGIPRDGIHSTEDLYGEYSRTALYAFENALGEISREQEPLWHPIEADKIPWLFSDPEKDRERGCIGHLRGDFGRNGDEFWTSWFDHDEKLKSPAFREELQQVVNRAREEGGLLHDFSSMRQSCRSGTEISHVMDSSYGFRMETDRYEYCLRCTARRGDYNFYLYCFDREAQREFTAKKSRKPHEIKKQKKKEIER